MGCACCTCSPACGFHDQDPCRMECLQTRCRSHWTISSVRLLRLCASRPRTPAVSLCRRTPPSWTQSPRSVRTTSSAVRLMRGAHLRWSIVGRGSKSVWTSPRLRVNSSAFPISIVFPKGHRACLRQKWHFPRRRKRSLMSRLPPRSTPRLGRSRLRHQQLLARSMMWRSRDQHPLAIPIHSTKPLGIWPRGWSTLCPRMACWRMLSAEMSLKLWRR
mmetsp:Transcript_49146/g.107094  ORF Transcript_49146/g.107094 Transcript_49146/m.107094 type:complete len:217 (+) Transcript_49146:157-807(+)